METVERTKGRRIGWRWLPVAVVFVVLVLAGGVTYCWLGNTQELPIVDSDAGTVAPGGTISIALPGSNGCGSQPWELYRNRYGRWQQTHGRTNTFDSFTWARVDDPLLRWPKSEERFYEGHCYIGNAPTTMTMPADITWSPVAVCGEGGGPCVEVEIELDPS